MIFAALVKNQKQGTVSFVCVLQEVLDFELRLQNWSAKIERKMLDNNKTATEAEVAEVARKLEEDDEEDERKRIRRKRKKRKIRVIKTCWISLETTAAATFHHRNQWKTCKHNYKHCKWRIQKNSLLDFVTSRSLCPVF